MMMIKFINILAIILVLSTGDDPKTIILKQSAQDNSIVINEFVFDNPETNEELFRGRFDGYNTLNSDSISKFEQKLSIYRYATLLELDSFRIRTATTQGVVIDDIERGVLIIDTVVFKKPYKDTIFIEIDLPKFKLPEDK